MYLAILSLSNRVVKHNYDEVVHPTNYGGLNLSRDVLPLNGMGLILIIHPTQLP